MYAFYKASLPFLSSSSVLCIQNTICWLLIFPFVLRKGGRSFLASNHLGSICLRSLFSLLTAYCITFAITKASLAEVTLLNNIAPLCVPFIAYIWMKEKIDHRLWLPLGIGFLGVATILQPWGSGTMSLGLVAAALSGVLVGCAIIVTRRIAHEPFLRILFYLFSLETALGINLHKPLLLHVAADTNQENNSSTYPKSFLLVWLDRIYQ
ncbi:MAG: DMT family transporter, partial [Chlamydiales bacterium]